ncbi:hypothetical protein E2562_003736 [Oryza meyeriana var. granulata]|uniref:Uncharacterized protein n=1 Tax=Oryza meyeriana var. granulata TaxID=110450 RepID=A0A6G1BRY1_9ORYZ|nr:hypothetical protein E2562_003736 [Oryza meyeriana var. granulata]
MTHLRLRDSKGGSELPRPSNFPRVAPTPRAPTPSRGSEGGSEIPNRAPASAPLSDFESCCEGTRLPAAIASTAGAD